MADKYISEYTNQTAPASSSELLIDEGSGVYKALTISDLFTAGVPAATSSAPFYIGSASVDGSIRIYADSPGVVIQLRISGVWQTVLSGVYSGE